VLCVFICCCVVRRADGVYQYKYKTGDDEDVTVFQYEIENTLFQKLLCKFDFTGTTNFNLTCTGTVEGMCADFTVPPMQSVVAITLIQINPDDGWSFKLSQSMSTAEPDAEDVAREIHLNVAQMTDQLQQCRALFPPDAVLDVDTVTKRCLAAGRWIFV
jgi:hypothetical protein